MTAGVTVSGLARAALPVAALAVLALTAGSILVSAGSTLGYDYQAYVRAADRLLAGEALYDPGVDLAGGFAIYLYPPPFALAFVPFALLPDAAGTWLWAGLLIGALVAGCAILPVRPTVRWLVLLLAALDWPVLYALKLGQVGPLLFLLFAVGWRCLERPLPLGTSIGLGALVKVQPAILVGWAVLTGRLRAAAVAVVVAVLAAIAATLLTGPAAWADYVALLGRVSSPITTPHNFTPGAVAWQLGAGETAATAIQEVTMLATVAAVVVSALRSSAAASFLVAIVASQLLSPLLWDHYAIVLLLPVAWLVERGRWWAVAIPLATSLPLVGIGGALVYPAVFGLSLIAPIVVDRAAGPGRSRAPGVLPADWMPSR